MSRIKVSAIRRTAATGRLSRTRSLHVEAQLPRDGAVVVSENVRNRMRDDLIVVPVFSAGQLGPTRVTLPARSSRLRHNSVIFCEEITTIDRDFLARGPVGSLSPKLMEAVVRSTRRAIGEVVPEP